MKYLLWIILLMGISRFTYSQNNDVQAKASFLAAEESYSRGDFKTCIQHLTEATEYLGRSVPAISCLKSKSLFQLKRYEDAQKETELFFTLNPVEGSYEYNEMLKQLSDLKVKSRERDQLLQQMLEKRNIELIREYVSKFPTVTKKNYGYGGLLIAEIYFERKMMPDAIKQVNFYLSYTSKMEMDDNLRRYREKAKEISRRAEKYMNCISECWMTENLNVDKFSNGDPISQATTWREWKQLYNRNKPAWMYYNGKAEFAEIGKIYNFNAISESRELCPEGFHVATNDDWKELINYLKNMYPMLSEDQMLRHLRSTDGWKYEDNVRGGLNTLGFNAEPFGYYNFDEYEKQLNSIYAGVYACWWSSFSKKPDRSIYPQIFKMDDYKVIIEGASYFDGYFVRCVKDNWLDNLDK